MLRVVEQVLYGVAQRLWISRRYQDSGISYYLREGASGCTDHRDTACHGLSGRDSETFVEGGYNGDGCFGLLPDEFGMADAARDLEEITDMEFLNLFFDAAVFFGRSDHYQLKVVFT